MPDFTSIEKQYILELNRGSYRAFDALYSIYSRRLYAFALKMTKSHSDAKEIVQDTFVRLWLNRENVLPEDSFQAYLFTIAKNAILNKMRTLINMPVFVDYMEYMNERRLSENNITEAIEMDEFRKKLEQAKESLSETQLKVFELSRELGYSHSEVAQQLNLSEQTVRNQLSLALKTLRKKLADNMVLFAIFFL
ncbi:MAG: RNA polymerase sigma-70 factor [Paludibacter sp.]|nr:RNA polymerase sigma-70 factor [Paludibacter sp.]MDD4199244.1 RNA polymerase sigma-70 factor [Paludibacter sp.]MDD4428109.1 RNA polymerase sigma-70 factor [Paludibacter sp.]